MNDIVNELNTTKQKKYNIKKQLKKYESKNDSNVSLYLMYQLAVKYYNMLNELKQL